MDYNNRKERLSSTCYIGKELKWSNFNCCIDFVK